MKQVLKEFKKEKYTTICICAFIILLIVAFIFYNLIFKDRGVPVMGDRIEGIEDVIVTEEVWNKIIDEIKKDKNVVDVHLATENEGKENRTLDMIIIVKDKTKVNDAKNLTKIVVNNLSAEQLAYFDIEIYIDCEKENSGYPFIAHKNKNNKDFSY